MTTTLHLRSECKTLEKRSALTPATTKTLLDTGYTVNIERSQGRIFDDSEFEAVGATLVPEGSWVDAPRDSIIVGLKELPQDTFALKHTHIYFAHCYKQQSGWKEVLSRFLHADSQLYDLEFLSDETGRRVAAFGYYAGYTGAALAIKAWAHYQHPEAQLMPGVSSYPNQDDLLTDIKAELSEGERLVGRTPRVLIIGALGRCGRGAVDLCKQVGIPDDLILKWDLPETAKGGPFEEIVESDIYINCIYLSEKISPFVNNKSLSSDKRKLSVVCDISCDTTNPHNPIPIYTENSTFSNPTLPIVGHNNLHVISIDHLPSLLPREASEAFSQALLPSLLLLKDRKNARVWQQAGEFFNSKVATLPADAVKQTPLNVTTGQA